MHRLGICWLCIHISAVEQVHQVGDFGWRRAFSLAIVEVEVKLALLLFFLLLDDRIKIEVVYVVAANVSRLVGGKLLKVRPEVQIVLVKVLLLRGILVYTGIPLLLRSLLRELDGPAQVCVLISGDVVSCRCGPLGLSSALLWLVTKVTLKVVTGTALVHQMVK